MQAAFTREIQFYWHCFVFSLALPFLVSCSVTQVVPIQLARIQQTDSYIQRFHYPDVPVKHTEQTYWLDRTLNRLLGIANWQALKDRYGLGNFKEELFQDGIYIRGQTHLTIYPDPYDHELFSIAGSGRFFLIRDQEDEIMLTGDFIITQQQHAVDELQRGYLVLPVELIISRIPMQMTHYHRAPLKYKIYIDNSLADQGIYSIDYARPHYAFITDGKNVEDDNKAFASVTFDLPPSQNNLIDFRGMEFLRQDYQRLKKMDDR